MVLSIAFVERLLFAGISALARITNLPSLAPPTSSFSFHFAFASATSHIAQLLPSLWHLAFCCKTASFCCYCFCCSFLTLSHFIATPKVPLQKCHWPIVIMATLASHKASNIASLHFRSSLIMAAMSEPHEWELSRFADVTDDDNTLLSDPSVPRPQSLLASLTPPPDPSLDASDDDNLPSETAAVAASETASNPSLALVATTTAV